jgi:hypothetical protein
MSIRVLEVPLGQRYNHCFLDDLESFFWLILWSVAAHLEPGAHHPTRNALKMMNCLDQSLGSNIGAPTKASLLGMCYFNNGAKMRNELASSGKSGILINIYLPRLTIIKEFLGFATPPF